MKIRLNKFLAETGLCSRRKCDELIEKGDIYVNDQKIDRLGVKIDPQIDIIKYKGKILQLEEKVLIVLNKPKGYLCTCKKSKKTDKTVLDLVKIKQRIYPIGRLDKDSSGLLLLTNDGELANKLMHPRYEKQKQYIVKVHKPVTRQFLERLRKGVRIDNYKTRSAVIKKITSKKFDIIIKEGKKRQIRRMCSALGFEVLDLKRIRVGEIELGNLKQGDWKYIDNDQFPMTNVQ